MRTVLTLGSLANTRMEDRGRRMETHARRSAILHPPFAILVFLTTHRTIRVETPMTSTRTDRTILTAPGTIDHHVADLTATIAADVALSTVQETLGAMGQWLPIDGDAEMPVGELIETNSTG